MSESAGEPGPRRASARADRRLLAELRRTLRDELGAQALYRRLARRAERGLDGVLRAHVDESAELVQRMLGVLAALGVNARARSFRRELAATVWAGVGRVAGARLPLRLCLESEEILARRYADLARMLRAHGEAAAARDCEALAGQKAARARALAPWVPR